MPKIKNQRETERAVSEISSLVGYIKVADEFITKKFSGDEYSVGFSIPVPGDYSDKFESAMICKNKRIINSMVRQYKNESRAKIISILEKHPEIELDDEEMSLVYVKKDNKLLYAIWVDENNPFLIGSIYILQDLDNECYYVKQGNCDAVAKDSVTLISKEFYELLFQSQQSIYNNIKLMDLLPVAKEHLTGICKLKNVHRKDDDSER